MRRSLVGLAMVVLFFLATMCMNLVASAQPASPEAPAPLEITRVVAQSDNYILVRQGTAAYYNVYYSDGSKQVEKRSVADEGRYATSDGTIEAELVRDHKGMERVWVKFRPIQGSRKKRQDLNFMAPGGARLQPGNYTGGFRLGYLGGGHLSVQPSSMAGSFEIMHIAYAPDGQLSAFDAKFRDKRGDYALYGEVRYRR